MKRSRWLVATLAISLGCSQAMTEPARQAETSPASAKASEAAFNAGGAPTVTFSVPNMMCEDSCVPTVRETLAAQPGVKDVKVELATKTATVAVDEGKFDSQRAIAALVDLQFTDTKLLNAAAKAKSDAAATAREGPKS